MSGVKVLALIALVPAAFNVSAASARSIMIQLCTGDGQVHTVPLSPAQPSLPGDGSGACCVKGCHGGGSRKKTLRQI